MKRFTLIVLICSILSCAPSLRDTMSVDVIPESGSDSGRSFRGVVKLRIERFNDSRVEKSIAEINGRKVAPEGDLGTTIQRGFERAFRARGAAVTLFDAPLTISGDVTEWKLTVRPGFPTTHMEAGATVKVYLTESNGRIVYRGSYTGTSTYEHPYPQQSQIEDVLGRAMSEAIEAAVKDTGLAMEIQSRAGSLRESPSPASALRRERSTREDFVVQPPPTPHPTPAPAVEEAVSAPIVERVTPQFYERDRY